MPTKYCPVCKSKQLIYARFCNQCGEPFYENTSATDTPKPKSYDGVFPYLIGIATAVAAVIILGVVGMFVGGLSQLSKGNAPTATVASGTPIVPVSAISLIPTPSIIGKVVGVTDGDTITVLDDKNNEHKVRLAGIDAPESGQDFGTKAKQHLSSLVYKQEVAIFGDKIDKYGRLVGKVIVNGIDANFEMVKAGFAWHYKKYASEQSLDDQRAYAEAESAARSSKSNLWSMPNPIAPWDFRENGNVDPALKDKIFGNSESKLYHWFGCPGFAKISLKNRVVFDTWEDAEADGYTAVTNCKNPKPESRVDTETVSDDALTNLESELKTVSTAPTPTYREYRKPYPTPDIYYGSTATAKCRDGSYSYAKDRYEACSENGGVEIWFPNWDRQPTPVPLSTPVYAPRYEPPEYSPPAYRPPVYPSYSAPTYSNRTYSPPRPPDGAPKTVQVRGYIRKDGTYVQPHTRRAPRRY